MPTTRFLAVATLLLLAPAPPKAPADEAVSFRRDVLPILSDRCFHCHGPDEQRREADLRLDDRHSATADRGDYFVIVPGRPDQSELVRRIEANDPSLRMPPIDSHVRELNRDEVDLLRRWIADGAKWEQHWAFVAPQRPRVPDDAPHPLDAFVRRRLSQEGLQPSPRTEAHTLARRVSFDVTGLPPSPDEVQRLVKDRSQSNYEQLVDELLASPHFGERMAMWWLDAARYSDTDGFQQDATRQNWPWRDWVIEAFNADMPFDQFTIEQFAGDLLPDATVDQQLATCFHRNHMTNGEGGRDPEESRIDYVIDRVNTVGTVWLGLTLGCCQCHSHKFDPLSQREYYQLFAFFNSIDEDGKAGNAAKPYLKVESPYAARAVAESLALVESRTQRLDVARQTAKQEFVPWLNKHIDVTRNGIETWHPPSINSLESAEGTDLKLTADGTIQAGGPNPNQDDYRVIATTGLRRVTGWRLEVFSHASHTGGKFSRGATGEFILTDVKLQVRKLGNSQLRDIELAGAVADVEKKVSGRNYGNIKDTLDDDPRNGWTTAGDETFDSHVAVFALADPLSVRPDDQLVFVLLQRSTDGDANIGRFRIYVTDQPGNAVRSLEPMPLEQLAEARVEHAMDLPDSLRTRLFEQFLADHQGYQRAKDEYDRAARQLAQCRAAAEPQDVMVLSERAEPRPTFVLKRGVWDSPGEPVERAIPAALSCGPIADSQKTVSRLELAKWLIDRNNPLTARVIVNQLWQLCFGTGLVRTPEDFGRQGEQPTHPELLDWLAVELMDHNWELKHVLRIILTSETYQQSSRIEPTVRQRDPENRLYARGSRFRLPSWMIRDAALCTSGLLKRAIGGPPVMPYQPDGVWEEMFMGRFHYEPSQGPAQHRRTLYAFWRRSSTPTFLFDQAQRRVCEVRPRQTNTPLHALTMLNDESILEASRELAKSIVANCDGPSDRMRLVVKAILSREPNDSELSILEQQYVRALETYQDDEEKAKRLLDFGQPELRCTGRHADVAATMIVASMVYNLDEAISRE
ncbi:MAG: PSD1 and planctomycete cytochrome C domain-containing protein [Pirellulaceae bacterium]|nr:PSD1 domain-containing protein [Planctomycetales bacterium]